MFSELKNRLLWYDGKSSMDVDTIAAMLLNGDPIEDIFCIEYDNEVDNYNKLSKHKLDVKYGNSEINSEWNIPNNYKNINLQEYVLNIFKNKNLNYDTETLSKAESRIQSELVLVNQTKLTGLFLCIIYLLDVFKEHNILWGVGRGSSCASYILYLLDLHCVDPVIYDISENEFFKETINKIQTEGE